MTAIPADLAPTCADLPTLEAHVTACRACPRLVAWREQVAAHPRKAFAGQRYWAKPIPGWGEEGPKILLLGLAPAAHGGNRTGRIFTGDRSGDFLFAALHRAGLAALPTSTHADDGQRLLHTRMVAAVRCAPPGNAPTPAERDTCAPWLDGELRLVLPTLRVVVALGAFGWDAALGTLARNGFAIPRPRPRFGHGRTVEFGERNGGYSPISLTKTPLALLGCYHPSQQNTFTGTLTPAMLDEVLTHAKALADLT